MALSPVLTCSVAATAATVLRVMTSSRMSVEPPTAVELFEDFKRRDTNDNGVIDPDEEQQTLTTTPVQTGVTVGRIIVAGAVMTGALLGVEQVKPSAARGLAALILITSFLVNGVAVFDAVTKSVGASSSTPTATETAAGSPTTPTSPPQSEQVIEEE